MRLALLQRLLLDAPAGRPPLLGVRDALPLAGRALLAVDADVRHAMAELLVRAHYVDGDATEAWLAAAPAALPAEQADALRSLTGRQALYQPRSRGAPPGDSDRAQRLERPL